MRITTRLTGIATVTIAALIIMVPILIWAISQFNSAKNDYVLANSILDNFFERASFRDQFFLYHEDRLRKLWDQNKAISDRLLGQAQTQFYGEDNQQLLEQLRGNIDATAVIFHRIVNNIKTLNSAVDKRQVYEELDKRLSSQLLLKAAAVRDKATALKDASAQRVELTYQHLTIIVGVFAFVLALATILTSIHLSRLIHIRLAPLHDGAKIVADGNLDYRIKIEGSDEFSELALSLNAMTDKLQHFTVRLESDLIELKRSEVALQASEERWKFALEGAGDGVWDWNPKTDETMFSKRWKEMVGYAEQEFQNTGAAWIEQIHPDDKDRVTSSIQEYFAGKLPLYVVEFRMRCKDGSWKWILARGMLVNRDVDGHPLRMIGTHTDITERKQAEETVRRLNAELEQRVIVRTAKLEEANKELEAFSYSVSHDLRAPLRAIDGFSHILLTDYTDKLDEEGKRLLNVVRDNTTRMGQLIDDILKFSRTGRLELTFSEIDMERLSREVVEELKSSIPVGTLQVEIEPIPPAKGDHAMMRQVIVNLLSNAIKFSSSRPTIRIKVGCYVEGREDVYFVQDNGVGFDMQYADKLFGVFQRLHSMNEFEGTGIGLAIVKRIITRHGGRVWAEGRLNEGTTIYFALPAREE